MTAAPRARSRKRHFGRIAAGHRLGNRIGYLEVRVMTVRTGAV